MNEHNSRRSGGGSGAPRDMGQGGPQGNPSGPRDANDPGSTRYGKTGPTTGASQRSDDEKKQDEDWKSRQGGDQSSDGG